MRVIKDKTQKVLAQLLGLLVGFLISDGSDEL